MCSHQENPSLLDKILASANVQLLCVEEAKLPPISVRPVVIVHAGAEDIPEEHRCIDLETVKAAARDAYYMLLKQVCALDVAEMTIKNLETYYQKQCGKADMVLEMDAAIIDENNFKAGCVGAVQKFRHPVTLAKHVMQKTDHIIIVGEGAEMLVDELSPQDKEQPESYETQSLNSASTVTEKALGEDEDKENVASADLKEDKENVEKDSSGSEEKKPEYKLKTFGTVVFDAHKHLSCATVVFRTTPEHFGRLSATGIVPGCGVSGDTRGCSSISGEDTALYVYAPARGVLKRLEDEENISVECALRQELEMLKEKTAKENFGGVVVDVDGTPGVFYTSKSFPWAYCANDILFYGCSGGEVRCEKVDVSMFRYGCFCKETSGLQDGNGNDVGNF